jgi:hypothetical protein
VYQLQRQHALALSAYDGVLQLDATVPMLRNNMAASYIETGAYAEAKLLLEQTLREEPANPFAWTNLAVVLQHGRDPAAVQVAAERACALAPDYMIALQICSNIHKELQEWDNALALIQRGLILQPGDASMLWSLAMLQLLRGDYAAGWPSHEGRWNGSPELYNSLPNLPALRWQGESLAGKTLFVWSEQGNGDVIQHVRFLRVIAERVRREGDKLVFCCYPGLSTLVSRSFGEVVDRIVTHYQSRLFPHDFHLPMASLPLMLNVTLDQLPIARGVSESRQCESRRLGSTLASALGQVQGRAGVERQSDAPAQSLTRNGPPRLRENVQALPIRRFCQRAARRTK